MNQTEQYLNQITNTASVNHVNNTDSVGQVEIVVPIFNGFQVVKRCLEALLQHTLISHPITLLDDASSDKQLTEYLLNTAQQHQQIQLITRKFNLGYLHNINTHLENTQHTVLLLNSDTEVTAGWLDTMSEVATDSRVGVVCPLSNHATILSLPDIETQHIEFLKLLYGLWFPLPTAVGFCMLIKAGLWQQLHGFDPFYDPGYGEECDFSMSVRKLGLQVACAPAAYVFHQGSQSFKNQANKLQQQHQHLLDLRWPLYSQEIKQFSAVNPVQWIKQWILTKRTQQPRILHVVHGLDNKGGVELFSKTLLQSFDDTFHHSVLIFNKGKKKRQSSAGDWPFEVIELDVNAFNPEHVIFNIPADLYQQKLDLYFIQLLQWAGFSYVHFHSRVGIGTAIWPQICYQLGIPYAMFFHDHSGLCQIFSLSTTINHQEIHCGKSFAVAKDQQCHQCLQNKTRKSRLTTQSYLSLREQIWQDNIEHAHHLQFCSDYLLDIYSQKFANIKTKSQVLNPCFFASQSTATKPMPNHQVKLAFLGQFGVLKGAQLFIDLYHRMSDEDIEWQIIGGIDPIYQPQLDQTEILTRGSYNSDELPDLLQSVDLIVFTTQIPETYGITLTEAMISGIPVVAPNLGAYTSRIKNQVNGVLYRANDISSLEAAVKQIINLQQSQQRIQQIEYKAPSCHAPTELNHLYKATIIQEEPEPLSADKQQALLKPPKINAYQVMQKWLDAPMTLEAAADWKPAPDGMNILILGTQTEAIRQTTNSLQQHLSNPVVHLATTASYKMLADNPWVLIIYAGNLINENMGNWLASFRQQQAVASLADYALHSHLQHIYAAQFMGCFSWQNLSVNHANIGCLLLKPKLIQGLVNQPFWSTRIDLEHVLVYLHQQHAKQVMHFPYFSYTMADHQFATHWKQQHQRLLPINKKPPRKVWVLVETHLTGKGLSALKQQYQQQNWDETISVHTHFISSDEKASLLNSMDFNDTAAVFVLADNVRLTDKNCLQKMLTSLYQSQVDVLTSAAARDINGQYLVAKKAGAANHFQGIGRIKDLRFTDSNAVHEHEWLDDDCWLFNAKAWQSVVKIYQHDNSFFTALKLSTSLQKQGFSIGILANNGLYKKALPTRSKLDPMPSLNNQRQTVIDGGNHLPIASHYPKAFSCRQGCQLDLVMTAFKTPKHLPRVIAYAQDDWASGFYRVKSPLNALAADNKISVHFLATSGQQSSPTPYEIQRMEADVLLLHGFYTDQQLAALNQYKKQLNIRVVISIDDLLTDIPQYNPFAEKIADDIKTRIKLACSLADALIVSTPELAMLLNHYHPHISVIPNRLSQHIWPNHTKISVSQNRLRVGWAGAGQHQADLAWLRPVVNQTRSFCDWVFFGDRPAGMNDCEFHPPVDLLQYPEKLQQLKFDIGVAPLVDNPFNRAKSSLKLLEYGVMGLPVMASNLPCYQHSPAILLDNDSKLWVEQLEAFNLNRDLLQQNGHAMLNWVHQGYWLEEHQSQWIKVLGLD